MTRVTLTGNVSVTHGGKKLKQEITDTEYSWTEMLALVEHRVQRSASIDGYSSSRLGKLKRPSPGKIINRAHNIHNSMSVESLKRKYWLV